MSDNFQLSLREGFRIKVIESLKQAWLLKLLKPFGACIHRWDMVNNSFDTGFDGCFPAYH